MCMCIEGRDRAKSLPPERSIYTYFFLSLNEYFKLLQNNLKIHDVCRDHCNFILHREVHVILFETLFHIDRVCIDMSKYSRLYHAFFSARETNHVVL
jgi:hypothetical protein